MLAAGGLPKCLVSIASRFQDPAVNNNLWHDVEIMKASLLIRDQLCSAHTNSTYLVVFFQNELQKLTPQILLF